MSSKAEVPSEATIKASAGETKQHWKVDVKFPVYAIDFIQDSILLLAGGGGSSKSGIRNRFAAYKVESTERRFDLLYEHSLSKIEDAPMTLILNHTKREFVTGINSSVEELKKGKNENLRVYSYDNTSITLARTKETISTYNEEHYQKVTAITRSTTKPALIVLGTSNSQFSLVNYDTLEPVSPAIDYGVGEEIYDVDFNDEGNLVLGTSSTKLIIWSTKPVPTGEEQDSVQIIERPILRKEIVCTFRAAKFGRKSTSRNLYTVVNAAPSNRSRKAARGERKSFISRWDMDSWKLLRSRSVGDRPTTAFVISDDGSLLAYGSSDLSVGILDATSLSSIRKILQAHDFPVTTLRFNLSATLLASASADNSVRIIEVPKVGERGKSNIPAILIGLLIILLAIYVQSRLSREVIIVAAETLAL